MVIQRIYNTKRIFNMKFENFVFEIKKKQKLKRLRKKNIRSEKLMKSY